MFDLETAILDHLQPGGAGLGGGLVVTEPQLEPDHLGPDGDRLIDDVGQLVVTTEDIDDVGDNGEVSQ